MKTLIATVTMLFWLLYEGPVRSQRMLDSQITEQCVVAETALTAVAISDTSSKTTSKRTYTQTGVNISSDGWILHGNLTMPRQKSQLPMVLLLNKANGNRKVYSNLAALLAERNIASLSLDLRGEGESINLGKFIPFDDPHNEPLHLDETYKDIIQAHQYMISLSNVDTTRIALVGASYSGEEMMKAARRFKYAKAYVALSPGSFSDESIGLLDSSQASWLFVKSQDEKSVQGFEKEIFDKTSKPKIIVVAGKSHATDILMAYPDMNEIIANWLATHF